MEHSGDLDGSMPDFWGSEQPTGLSQEEQGLSTPSLNTRRCPAWQRVPFSMSWPAPGARTNADGTRNCGLPSHSCLLWGQARTGKCPCIEGGWM